jgi:hypothetical protein
MWDGVEIAQMASSRRQRMGDFQDVEGPLHQRFGRQDRMAQILDRGRLEGRPTPSFFGQSRAGGGLLCDWIITFVSVHGEGGKTL